MGWGTPSCSLNNLHPGTSALPSARAHDALRVARHGGPACFTCTCRSFCPGCTLWTHRSSTPAPGAGRVNGSSCSEAWRHRALIRGHSLVGFDVSSPNGWLVTVGRLKRRVRPIVARERPIAARHILVPTGVRCCGDGAGCKMDSRGNGAGQEHLTAAVAWQRMVKVSVLSATNCRRLANILPP